MFRLFFQLPEHGAYLVDSLIGLNPIMKDWTCMTNLLLSKLPPDEDFLDDVQETCLVKIMVFSVQQAATGKPPAGRHSNQMVKMAFY